MKDLILHQYKESPWATKIRYALGLKGLPVRTVRPPMVLPKEDHFEISGGYRRVPILQIGANIYCDSHCIMNKLDELQPSPPLRLPGREAEEMAFTAWLNINFDHLMGIAFGAVDLTPEFIADRVATMMPPGTDLSLGPKVLGSRYLQIEENVAYLEQRLADGRPFLFGEQPCGADFAAVHPLQALLFELEDPEPDSPGNMSDEVLARNRKIVAPYPATLAWIERTVAQPQCATTPIDSAEAIAAAAAAEPVEYKGEPVVPDGLKLGQSVVVIHEVYGSGEVYGELAASPLHEIAVRRRGDRIGEVICHFPRNEFILAAADQ